MELTELIHRAGSFVAVPAMLAVFLLLPLYLSQRRDIARREADGRYRLDIVLQGEGETAFFEL